MTHLCLSELRRIWWCRNYFFLLYKHVYNHLTARIGCHDLSSVCMQNSIAEYRICKIKHKTYFWQIRYYIMPNIYYSSFHNDIIWAKLNWQVELHISFMRMEAFISISSKKWMRKYHLKGINAVKFKSIHIWYNS